MVNGKGIGSSTRPRLQHHRADREGPAPTDLAIFDDAAKRAATYGNAGAAKKQDLPGPTGKKWVNDVIDENLANGRVLQADTFRRSLRRRQGCR